MENVVRIKGQVHQLSKLYYSISEVAAFFDVNTSLIRYWEKEFTTIRPKKNKNGERRYIVKDIRAINVVFDLLKVRGFTIEGAILQLKNPPKSSKIKINELIVKLTKLKQNLQNYKDQEL